MIYETYFIQKMTTGSTVPEHLNCSVSQLQLVIRLLNVKSSYNRAQEMSDLQI